MSIKYQRRSREQWQQIIEQFQASGQSGAAFCKAHAIPYASFCQWKQTLSAVPAAISAPADGGFVDLQLKTVKTVKTVKTGTELFSEKAAPENKSVPFLLDHPTLASSAQTEQSSKAQVLRHVSTSTNTRYLTD